MRQIVIPLIENFALLLVLAYLMGQLPWRFIRNTKLWPQSLIGIVFGVAAVISMNFPVDFGGGVLFESQTIFIALAGAFGGYFTLIITGVMAALYQVYFGDNEALVSVSTIVLPFLFGAILVKFPLQGDFKLRFSKLALGGIVMGVLISPTGLLLADKKLGLELLQAAILTMPFIFMIAFPVADRILNLQVWQVRVEDTHRQNEEALRDAQKIGHFGSWETDMATEQIIWSDELYRLLEREPSLGPLNRNSVMSYLELESRMRYLANSKQAMEYGSSSADDYSLTLPSGRSVHHFCTIRPVKNEAGDIIKLSGTIQDITERKNVEESLKLTEAQRRALFKSIPMPINCWRQVDDDFELFDYNEASLVMTDGKIAEIQGVKYTAFNPTRPDILDGMKRCIALKENFSIENSHTLYNTGKVQDQVLTFAYCPPNVVMIMTEDITAMKKSSHELALSEQRFREFARTAADDLWETDDSHHYSYFFSNLAKDFPPTLGSLIGSTADLDKIDLRWGKQRKKMDAHRSFRDFRFRRTDNTGHNRHLRISGDPVFDEDGTFKGYRGSTFDETKEVEARAAARGAQEIFAEAMENVSEGIILWDADDKLVTKNSRYLEMFPDMAAAVETKITLKHYLKIRAEIGYVLLERQNLVSANERPNKPGESQITVVETVAKGDLIYRIRQEVLANGRRIVFHNDITDEKRQEEQLHQALKMEAVGQLTGGIAHDFNNILSAVLGNLELILQKWSDDENLISRVSRAKDSVLRGAELTRRLLAFSRKQNLNPKSLNFKDLIEGMQDLLERSLGEDVAIENSSADGLWPVFVDTSQIENAILNLAINARDAMPSGGVITTHCRNVTAREIETLEFSTDKLGDCVCISISDTGEGMPPEHLERVFEPFFTTKEVGRGSGLGLSMVYGFVTQTGGHINIESVLGQGTVVSLYLPKYTGDVEQTVDIDGTASLVMGQGEKILVVEDDLNVRDMILNLLARLGYEPYDCGDGQRLIKMEIEEIRKFDVLLCDVILPHRISGPIVVRHALAAAPDIKVLLMTGYVDRTALFSEEDKADYPIINKPFRALELSRMIAQILQ